MLILGIESSCDETSAAVVEDGRIIHSLIIASQTELHARHHGVVPEVASRAHVEQILPVVREALEQAQVEPRVAASAPGEAGPPAPIEGARDPGSPRSGGADAAGGGTSVAGGGASAAGGGASAAGGGASTSRRLDGVAVTNRPGLSGSLAVGLTFAKAYAYAAGLPFVAVDHMHAHAYAPHLVRGDDATGVPQFTGAVPPGEERDSLVYPYLVLLVSGGHTMIAVSRGFSELEVLGTTIDDACGEAYDKVSVFLGAGYPGGPVIDRLAAAGDAAAARFPQPKLNHAESRYDVSFSGLKTAVVHQLDRFWQPGYPRTRENVAAAFQDAAVSMLMNRVERAVRETGIFQIAAGGGVAANSELRRRLANLSVDGRAVQSFLPPVELCMDNGAMVAGLGYHLLAAGERSGWDVGVAARVPAFRGR
ncbi:MAG: tRNA (adenosine(37)-N6)-threonylcarbamoyltransferase complex transferase subunit TsaD [Alkalispirochaeta sp.]